jgi:hypothetical protein
MSIPPLTSSRVLPPFVGDSPTMAAAMAPFTVGFAEFARRFGDGAERDRLLRGLVAYRAALRAAGLTGFQWIDGSFVEDVETLRQRPPADIDLVTFVRLPAGVAASDFAAAHELLFDHGEVESRFGCDAYVVDLGLGARRPERLVAQARYWYGLFSHQRASALWKGMLKVDLDSDDAMPPPAVADEGGSNDAQV